MTNYIQVLILCLSCFVATVLFGHSASPDEFISSRITAVIHKTLSPISSGSPSLPDLWSFLRHYIFPRENLISSSISSAYPFPPNLWRYLRCGIIYFKISGQPILSSLGVPGMLCHPQILTDQLTLSQSKEAYYARQIILAPLDFQTFRRLCQLLFENTEQANLPLQFFANKEKRKE